MKVQGHDSGDDRCGEIDPDPDEVSIEICVFELVTVRLDETDIQLGDSVHATAWVDPECPGILLDYTLYHRNRNLEWEQVGEPQSGSPTGGVTFTPEHSGDFRVVASYSCGGSGGCQSYRSFVVRCAGAYPVNLRPLVPNCDSNTGLLTTRYIWDSSTGDPDDLAGVLVREYVSYPSEDDPSPWPNPPWNFATDNPTILGVLATAMWFQETHLPGNWVPIEQFQEAEFTATQYYQYSCDADTPANPDDPDDPVYKTTGNWITLKGPLSITRTVTDESTQWHYHVEKADEEAVDALCDRYWTK